MGRPWFTVFTPTFDRAHTLPRVYRSLSAQTFRDFEWVIVDDGSQDGTPGLVASWRAQAPFPIVYRRQENAGKGAATNAGVGLASGELFLIADSDDEFLPPALERLHANWIAIPEEERDRFTGVTALCCDAAGRRLGDLFPRTPLDSDSLELFYRYRVRGEKWGFHRTDVIRRYPFPTGVGTRHFPEDVVWRAIARKYKTRFVNEVLRVYHQDAGGQLTRSSLLEWARFRAYYAQRMSEDLDWLPVAPLEFCRLMVQYARFCFLVDEGPSSQLARLESPRLRALWAAAAAPGLLLSMRDRALGRARAPGLRPRAALSGGR